MKGVLNFKTVAAFILLIALSASAWLVLTFVYLGIGGAVYYDFKASSLPGFFQGLAVLIVYAVLYIVSLIYLCKKFYSHKKLMAIIPPIVSAISALAGILWATITNFQIE